MSTPEKQLKTDNYNELPAELRAGTHLDFSPGCLVIAHCLEPKEKLWGLLVRLDAVGLVLRGLDLAAVEDWMRQEGAHEEPLIVPSTVYIPSHRIERVYIDESNGPLRGYEQRFAETTGEDIRQALVRLQLTP